jgi:hypothetical protein
MLLSHYTNYTECSYTAFPLALLLRGVHNAECYCANCNYTECIQDKCNYMECHNARHYAAHRYAKYFYAECPGVFCLWPLSRLYKFYWFLLYWVFICFILLGSCVTRSDILLSVTMQAIMLSDVSLTVTAFFFHFMRWSLKSRKTSRAIPSPCRFLRMTT